MERRAFIAAVALAAQSLLATPVTAQDVTLTRATPDDARMSAAVLRGAVGLYEEAVARGDLAGAVLLVARDGKVVLHEAVGMRDVDRGLPMEPNTMFRMASNTKPVVAAGVAKLVERDQLGFDDLVREHIPAWDNYRAGFISVHHLLTHTSGLRIGTLFLRPYMPASAQHPDAPSLKLEAARFGAVGAEVTPGTTYSYSNPGYNTLGALIEIASGKPLEVFLHDEIYAPLGMHDTYHHEVADKLDGKLERMGAVYYERRDG
jgi:CubicO group peptidase (beta-lactamase class C family)